MPDSSLALLLSYLAVTAILVITPGVGTASLIATVISHGRKAGYLTRLGMVLGAAIYALAAAAGLSALLRMFPSMLRWIAILGGVFIVWLGGRSLVATLWPRSRAQIADGLIAAGPVPDHAFVRTGIAIALGNAPLPLFYLVVVPQYVPKSMSPFTGAILLSAMHLIMAGTWMTVLVTALGRLVDVFRRPRVLLTMQLLTGVALILLGARSVAGAL